MAKFIITLDNLDTTELVDNLVGEKWELRKVISLLEAVNSGTLSASALCNVDDTTYTVLTSG